MEMLSLFTTEKKTKNTFAEKFIYQMNPQKF